MHVALDTSERIVREVVAGSPQGAIRRIVLYLVVAAALCTVGQPWIGAIGLVALTLLIATDRLV